MDASKKAAFVKAMGKRQKFAKGGLIRAMGNRKYFAAGGTTLNGPGDGVVNSTTANPNSGLMGTLNGLLGMNDNYRAGVAQIQQGTNAAQLNQAYTGAQDALTQQAGIANTLNPQVGTAVQNQNTLAQQYMDMSQGKGPNPAQTQLAQATAQNVANQNAMMAGQRGAAGNVGLMARQAAQQGAATQQAAAGQAATLGAQQQIAAQQNLANLSNNQVSQAGQATTGLNSAQQNEQSILQNANTAGNNAAVGMQSNVNNVNSQTAAANQNQNANLFGGIMSGFGAMSMLAKGGEVGGQDEHLRLAEMNAHSLKHAQRYSEGGDVVDQPDLGTFKASDNSAEGPNIGSTAALPAMKTDLSHAIDGGGGGGAGGIMSLLADGGQIQGNPLTGHIDNAGPASWGGGGGAPVQVGTSGPNVASTSALPKNGTDLSKSMASGKPQQSPNQTDDDARQGYLDADAKLGVAGVDNREEELPADNLEGPMAARGGRVGHFHNYFAGGGQVPAMVSPGEIYLSPEKVRKVIEEGQDPAKIGERIPGKAKVKGDSYSNDTVPKNLEEGGVVIDRKNMGSREKRELFVHRALARKKVRG